MRTEEIRKELFLMQDRKYRDFQSRLMPTVDPERMIGVRTPALRKLAKEMGKSGDSASFLAELPHRYFDENQLHAFLLSEMKDFPRCMEEVERFLPYIDNWATCDQLSEGVPKAPEGAASQDSGMDPVEGNLHDPVRHRHADAAFPG